MSGQSQRPPWLGEDHRTWDHVRIHIQLLRDDRLGAFHLAAYMGLAMHADIGTGDARPAAATLGSYANMSERTARRAMDDLVTWGYLAVDNRRGMASVYRLLPPPELGEPRKDSPTLRVVDPGLSDPQPRTDTTRTPDCPSDEQEPGTRTREQESVAGDATSPMLVSATTLCTQFADALGTWGKLPTVTQGWVRDMDLLLRVDGRDPAAVATVIRWLTAAEDRVSSFWRPNVRSPRKLREQWDAMADQYRNLRAAPGSKPRSDDILRRAADRHGLFDGSPVQQVTA